jgi:hypothetical protein
LEEYRALFNAIIPGIKDVWLQHNKRVKYGAQCILENISKSDFLCLFSEDFYGYNIKKYITENTFPTKSSDEYIVIDSTVENILYDRSILVQNDIKFWEV